MALPALDENAPLATPPQPDFDVVRHYGSLLERDDPMPAPVAAVETLAELVSRSDSSTIQELLALLDQASAQLASASFNPVSAQSGTALFMRYLTLQRPPPEMSFAEFKQELVGRAREFVRGSGRSREVIAANMSNFIQDGNTILVHSYSRVVNQALVYAAHTQKKRFQVYVTESRPFGLGLKTQAILTKAGIPCVVVLDSAVAYIMAKCDMAVVGAEAVCESGGLVNFIGGYQMAIAAKALGKPFYALAESFKFTRLFPLSQYDLPSSLPSAPLAFPSPDELESQTAKGVPSTPVRPMIHSKMPEPLVMSDEATRQNPILDYTTPDQVRSPASSAPPALNA
ncbi:translation initiation factor eIF-2B subunit alpha [Rhodotorula kratochvilovae]